MNRILKEQRELFYRALENGRSPGVALDDFRSGIWTALRRRHGPAPLLRHEQQIRAILVEEELKCLDSIYSLYLWG